MDAYERLKALVIAVEDDLVKARTGNKAAGTRVRKMMQDVKRAAQDVREEMIELRSGIDNTD
jgi:hypothetical protein